VRLERVAFGDQKFSKQNELLGDVIIQVNRSRVVSRVAGDGLTEGFEDVEAVFGDGGDVAAEP
jgi:hypothetical protein